MKERNIKIVAILLILLSVAVLHVKLYRFAEVTHDGALQVLVCLGRVIKIDTSDEADQDIVLPYPLWTISWGDSPSQQRLDGTRLWGQGGAQG